MIHDVISMSAGITEGENKRVIVISFDPRISPGAVAVFAAESVVTLIDKSDAVSDFAAAVRGEREPDTFSAEPDVGVNAAANLAEAEWKSGLKSERDKARVLAINVLDTCDTGKEDPYSEFAMLSRQYLRSLEKIARLSKILDDLLSISDERHSPLQGYTIEDLRLEAADRWPTPPEENE